MTEIPLPGATVTLPDGRVFTWLAFKPYTRKDGTDTELSVWQSHCAICGAPFTVATPKAGHTQSFYNKHCTDHKLSKAEATALWSKAGNAAKKAKRGRND